MSCITSPLCVDGCSFEAVSCHFIVVLMSLLLTRVYLGPFYLSVVAVCYGHPAYICVQVVFIS